MHFWIDLTFIPSVGQIYLKQNYMICVLWVNLINKRINWTIKRKCTCRINIHRKGGQDLAALSYMMRMRYRISNTRIWERRRSMIKNSRKSLRWMMAHLIFLVSRTATKYLPILPLWIDFLLKNILKILLISLEYTSSEMKIHHNILNI